MFRTFCLLSLLSLVGCHRPQQAEFRFNGVEMLKQERLSLPSGEHYADTRRDEIELMVQAWFGTPDQPRLPELPILSESKAATAGQSTPALLTSTSQHQPASLFRMKHLEVAAGPVRSDEAGQAFGLYREHCANCHGLTGDGAGATAGFLNPYPRDFRLGKFKFKSTPLRQAPTHEDLMTLLKQGIPGTAMPAFHRLPEAELEALADYVRYLSVRGQTERYLISELARLDDETLLSKNYETGGDNWTETELDAIAADATEQIGDDVLSSFFERWFEASHKISAVPTTPAALDPNDPEHTQWVEAGRVLYFGKGNCAECHGQTATGLITTKYYDDWTSDWIKSNGIDLENRQTYRDFLKAGALPPRALRPRNLTLGVMRGGRDHQSIYRKIANGIEGTPMPSSAATLKEDEIWALVVYVQSLGPDSASN